MLLAAEVHRMSRKYALLTKYFWAEKQISMLEP
jgi:hypothetical protein